MNVRPFIRGEVNISSQGVVIKFNHNTKEWMQTRGIPDPSGHRYFHYLGKKYYIHKLVAELFIPLPRRYEDYEGRMNVHHMDENKDNNAFENLEWMTHEEHTSHHSSGELHHNAKLTQDQVDEIRRSGHRSNLALAMIYGVSENTIYKIQKGLLWKKES